MESFIHIELEFGYALADIIKSPVTLLLLIEKFGLGGIDHYLHTGHVQDAVMQELVELGHLVQ